MKIDNKEKVVSRRLPCEASAKRGTATVVPCPRSAGLLAQDAGDVALGPTNQINRPLAVPSPGGKGQDEGELLSPPQAHLPWLFKTKSSLHTKNQTKIRPDQTKKVARYAMAVPTPDGGRLPNGAVLMAAWQMALPSQPLKP